MPINPDFLDLLKQNHPSAHTLILRPETGITLDEIHQLVNIAKNNVYLKHVALVDQQIDDKKAEALSGLVNIEILILESNLITDKGATALSKMPKLKELALGGNQLTSAGAKALAAQTSIKTLDLHANQLTDDVKPIFLNNHTLTHLDLSHNQISEKTLEQIESHIKRALKQSRDR